MTDFDELIAVLEVDGEEYTIHSWYEDEGEYGELVEDGSVEIEGADYWYDFDEDGTLIAESDVEDECEYAE